MLGATCFGQANFSSRMLLEGEVVYPDLLKENTFYFLPGPLELMIDGNEKPELKLMQMRYRGTSLRGDQGEAYFRNLLQFRISLKSLPAARLKSIQKKAGRKAGD